MYKQVEKSQNSEYRAIASPVAQNKLNRSKGFSFLDNRVEGFPASFEKGNYENSNHDTQQGIMQRVAKRYFSDSFYRKHIRDASKFTSYDAMVEEAAGVMRARAKQQMISASSLVFMTAYQQTLFCEQKHNYWQMGYASTTQFPIVEISSSGNVTVYSAAQFGYSGHDNGGVYEVDHYIPYSAYGHIIFSGDYSDFKEKYS